MRPQLRDGGPRTISLIEKAYAEEGILCPPIDENKKLVKLLYPRSYVELVQMMDHEKRIDYCFVCSLYYSDTFDRRAWILEFAKSHLTKDSYFVITAHKDQHKILGEFDYTMAEEDVFVPKAVPEAERAVFHRRYFELLSMSRFTLCPAGDAPWSMRFFEAILCKSIPIVSARAHTGRNSLERGIGYRYYLINDEHIYRQEWVDENYEKFIANQTLLGGR